jgi:hypothetical protein
MQLILEVFHIILTVGVPENGQIKAFFWFGLVTVTVTVTINDSERTEGPLVVLNTTDLARWDNMYTGRVVIGQKDLACCMYTPPSRAPHCARRPFHCLG